MKQHCFIHSGRSRFLCPKHRRAVRELAKKWNIDREAATFELRDFEIEIATARAARARELEAAIRTIARSKARARV
jgi:hypothetical protein